MKSRFNKKFTRPSGITSLMDDLGHALSSGSEMIMMGGGNPGHIPEVTQLLQQQMTKIVEDDRLFHRLVGIYAPPQGLPDYLTSLADLLNREYGWQITAENIALTNGSQSAFFMLFNLLAGEADGGEQRRIHLPLTPEYIGYTDTGLSEPFFSSTPPIIEEIDLHTFKYHIDFEQLKSTTHIGAYCVSRPTNPTGNVLTDNEICQLDVLAKEKNVPLIVDGAYGLPFPGLIFTQAKPLWNDNIILCLSLSKLGLPAARTGIVVAKPEWIKALAGINAVTSLATGNMGAMLTQEWVDSGEILRLSRDVINPWYQSRAQRAESLLREGLKGLPYALHKVEGAMFLWLWLKDFPVTSEKLYERLKNKGVLVVSGHYFFPGLDSVVPASDAENIFLRHSQECIRITYSQDAERVKKGLEIISDEIRRLYLNG